MSHESHNGSAGSGKGGSRAGAGLSGSTRRTRLDQLERTFLGLRAHLDTFCETLRAAKRVDGPDQPVTDHELAVQLRLTGALLPEFADEIDPLPSASAAPPREESQTGRRREDSQPRRKRT
jgi:hypothetical protein